MERREGDLTTEDSNWLAGQFEEHRGHLRAVAYRMLGSRSEAEDAVQETLLLLNRYGASGVENLGAWLTTVVARVCLDSLRWRKSRREETLDVEAPLPLASAPSATNPEQEAILADSVSLAVLVVLDRLDPPERLAFVMHDMFAVPFDEIASMVGRSEPAVRKLASRARERVRGVSSVPRTTVAEQRGIVDAFLAAMRAGDFDALVRVLDPNITVHIDAGAGAPGGPREIHGAANWAKGALGFSRYAPFTTPALVNGAVGLVYAPGGHLSRALVFSFANGKIAGAHVMADPKRLRELDLALLEDQDSGEASKTPCG
jgi:RNA polymerase sigma-70 factor (ECF subfamily)